jgi:dTDP-4-dehydrorhamnose 3,5-epimerase
VIFKPTEIAGVVVIEPAPHVDGRGHFARTFCTAEFAAHGLPTAFAQCSTTYNRRRGTLRGLHFQAAPFAEAKLIRCTRGRVFDVAVDLRVGSPAFGRWVGRELNEENQHQLFVPVGCAHGFCVLSEVALFAYKCSDLYSPTTEFGVAFDDPDIGIEWPVGDPILSAKDRAYPRLADVAKGRLPHFTH